MNNDRKLLPAIATTIILTAAMTFMATSSFYAFVLKSRSTASVPGSEKLYEALRLLEKSYYYPVDGEKLVEQTLENMIEGLGDPYTTYMDREEYQEFIALVTGRYAGIGAIVQWDEALQAVIIVNPFPESPAEKAGLVRGDKVLKIDGIDFSGTDLEGAVARMKGEKGTHASLTVLKADSGETLEINVVRDEIHIPSVDSRLDDGIGHIALATFDEQTGEDFKSHLDAMIAGGAKGIVLDLRDNGGGLVNSAEKVANVFLNGKDMIYYTQNKAGKRNEHRAYGTAAKIPLVILINENSASASELVAGALRDNLQTPLVGVKTFGKGVVQGTFPLSDESVIKLTVEKYFTPRGVDIDKKGLTPDYEVTLAGDGDEQYQRAVQVLRAQLTPRAE